MLGIYCRISREKEEGKDRSINDQKKIGLELAKDLVDDSMIFIDEGISGTLSIDERPEFSRLLDAVQDGKIDKVYVYDQSRLERNTSVRFIVKKILVENKCRLFTATGEVDLNNDEDDLMGDIMSVMNSYYVKITKRKVKSVLRRNASEGKAHGITAYGYANNKGMLEIDSDEIKIVKLIYQMSLEGVGTRSIAEHLNAQNVPTRYNKIGKGTISNKNKYTGKITTTDKSDINWAGNTIRNIIINPIYKGERSFSGKTYECPAIFTSSYWQKVNDNLSNNANNSGKKVEHKYMLKGLLRCAKCGRNYYGRTRVNKKDNYYMCSSKRYKDLNCGNRSINIDALEYFVWQRFFDNNEDEEINLLTFVKAHFKNLGIEDEILEIQEKIDNLDIELKALHFERDRAVKLAVKGILTDEDITSEMKRIESAINHKKDIRTNFKFQIESYKDSDNKISKIEDDLKNISFNDKSTIINKYIKNIAIMFYKDNYYLQIEFKIDGMKKENFFMDKELTFAVTQTIDGGGIIPLNNKFYTRLFNKELKVDWENLYQFEGFE